MGSSPSKAARKLPTRSKPSWAGARTETPAAGEAGPSRRPPPQYEAQDHKSQAILEDSKDPHLVGSLYSLGQVNVNRMSLHDKATPIAFKTQTQPAANPVAHMFASRKLSEEQAGSYDSIRNRMTAATLSELLDARKAVRSTEELKALAESYNIDIDLLENLARFVNTPSVGEQTSVKGVENGEDRIISVALWTDPVLDLDVKQIR